NYARLLRAIKTLHPTTKSSFDIPQTYLTCNQGILHLATMYRHRIDGTGSQRLRGHDYSSTGMYFVTLCTKHRIDYFGEVRSVNAGRFRHISLVPNEIGKTARKCWLEIPEHYPFVELDQFVIMPDHIHGLLFLNRP